MFFNWSFPSKKFIKINETNLGACGRIQKWERLKLKVWPLDNTSTSLNICE
jgi:hypothetical protein